MKHEKNNKSIIQIYQCICPDKVYQYTALLTSRYNMYVTLILAMRVWEKTSSYYLCDGYDPKSRIYNMYVRAQHIIIVIIIII